MHSPHHHPHHDHPGHHHSIGSFFERAMQHFSRGSRRASGFGFMPEGFGDGMFGGPGGLARGRKLGSADLQLLLLALLAEKPSHGYELIKSLDERSNGFYSPSPGMVYPALTYLEEIGYASFETQGAKKLYSITEAGLTHLESNRAAVDALLQQMAWIGERMAHMRRAMSGGQPHDEAADFDAPDAFRGRGRRGERGHGHGHSETDAGLPEVRQARRSLKSALIEKSGATLDEQRRIATILERAAAEIRAK